MSAVPGPPKPANVTPTWLMALLAMLCPGTAQSALPPGMPKNDGNNAPTPAVPSAGAKTGDPLADGWVMPAVRLRGLLTYDLRRDNAQARQGLTGTVIASTSTYLWRPWFATVNGNLGLTMLRHSGGGNAADSGSGSGVILTGYGQLSVLPRSPYPFEAHFRRDDSRVSFDLALANDYANQAYGFTQRYGTPSFDALLGWERNSQTSTGNGYNQQDNLQLELAYGRHDQRLRLLGNRISNTQQISGQQLVENNLSLLHSYTPDTSLSVESVANITRSAYQLQSGDTNTRLLQVNSTAFWRPAGQPISVIGGVRVFALGTEITGGANDSNAVAVRGRSANANANLGVNYEVNQFTRISAGANINLVQDNDGGKSLTTSQNLGGSYAPDAIEFGKFQYTWSTAVSANNQTGEDAARQLSLQLNHSLRRSYRLGDSSTIAVDGSQSVSTVFGGSTSGRETTASTRQLINNGSLSWDLSQQSGATQLRLSASDSRGLDGRQEYFQLVNFQASSNLQIGRFSSWTGNLTIQGIRQGSNSIFVNADPFNPQTEFAPESKFEITSHGSISYQNQRMFGVTHLRFTSDLRLNSQALLPLLGSAEDQKTAAWSNSVDYAIGRTQLRAQALLSTGSGPYSIAAPAADGAAVQKINKSILFTISRGFGND